MENRIFKNARQMKWMVSQMLRIRTAFAGLLFIFSLGFMVTAPLHGDETANTAVKQPELLGAGAAKKFPGSKIDWRGYSCYKFEYDGKPCMVITPKTIAPGKPWIFRAEFFDYKPEVDLALLAKGYHLAFINVDGMFGCPKAVSHWNAFYQYLTEKYGFAKKAVLEGQSRGALMAYNWGIANPDKVACVYVEAGVSDFKSWPAGNGTGCGNAPEWANLLKEYGLTEDEALAYKGNPIDNLEPLAKAKVPLISVHGKTDEIVPAEENALLVEQRYKKLGGEITVIMQSSETPFHKGNVRGHIVGLEDNTPVVEFILKHADK